MGPGTLEKWGPWLLAELGFTILPALNITHRWAHEGVSRPVRLLQDEVVESEKWKRGGV